LLAANFYHHGAESSIEILYPKAYLPISVFAL
jgi:hypothetical protein